MNVVVIAATVAAILVLLGCLQWLAAVLRELPAERRPRRAGRPGPPVGATPLPALRQLERLAEEALHGDRLAVARLAGLAASATRRSGAPVPLAAASATRRSGAPVPLAAASATRRSDAPVAQATAASAGAEMAEAGLASSPAELSALLDRCEAAIASVRGASVRG